MESSPVVSHRSFIELKARVNALAARVSKLEKSRNSPWTKEEIQQSTGKEWK